jgi:hypothetical protein
MNCAVNWNSAQLKSFWKIINNLLASTNRLFILCCIQFVSYMMFLKIKKSKVYQKIDIFFVIKFEYIHHTHRYNAKISHSINGI